MPVSHPGGYYAVKFDSDRVLVIAIAAALSSDDWVLVTLLTHRKKVV